MTPTIQELEARARRLRRHLATAYACDHDRTIGRLEAQLEDTEHRIAQEQSRQRRNPR